MSDATRDAIEQAIRAHLADEYPAEPWYLASWYLVTAASDADMDRFNYVHVSPVQPVHVSVGLVELAERRLRSLIEPDDD